MANGQSEFDPEFYAEPLEEDSGFNLLQMVWRRKSLIALGAVVGLVLGSLYYSRSTPIYESDAEVLVVKKRPEVVTGEQIQLWNPEDYVATHTVLIKSPLIVKQAITDGDLASLKTFAGAKGDLTQSIIGGLSVGRGSKELGQSADSILTLSFRGPQPQDCATVVQAILDSYEAFLNATYQSMSEDTVGLITKAQDMLQNDLETKEQEYREFRQSSPLLAFGEEGTNPRVDRLAMIESQRSELLLRRTRLEAQLTSIENAEKAGSTHDQLVDLVTDLADEAEMGTEDSSGSTLQSQLLPLLHEEFKLSGKYGPDHPKLRSVRQSIKATRRLALLPKSAYAEDADPLDAEVPTSDPVQSYVQSLRQALDRIKISDQLLSDLYDQEYEAAKELTNYELLHEQHSRSIARVQGLYDETVRQLQDASLVQDYGGVEAVTINPPRTGRKVEPQPTRVFPAALVLGVMLGFGMAYLAEVTDKSFRTPDEIRKQLGYPVVGHIPIFAEVDQQRQKTTANGLVPDSMLCMFHDSDSAGTEAFRGLRTSLYFSTRGQNHKLIQVTSATPGDGKSTLVSNLAVCIAQTGKKVLLIDADLRRPRLHRVFDVPSDSGLSSIVALDVELADAVQESGIANLSILPSGPLPPDPSELLTSQRFPELLETVRQQYDYVLVDTGPLLAISDPSVVAPRVDGVILTLRLSKNDRAQANQVKEILGSLDAKVLGIVVNAVGDSRSRGYGYGYRYGYRYKHYGYSGNYLTDENGKNGRKKRRTSTVNA